MARIEDALRRGAGLNTCETRHLPSQHLHRCFHPHATLICLPFASMPHLENIKGLSWVRFFDRLNSMLTLFIPTLLHANLVVPTLNVAAEDCPAAVSAGTESPLFSLPRTFSHRETKEKESCTATNSVYILLKTFLSA
jgi:hypothetical protein